MAKQKQHFANGLLADLRKVAAPADKDLVKKAIKESKKFSLEEPLFSRNTLKKTKKALHF